ncbi:hypothetical protein M408DRAFT_26734 [Serendipita vermifera MAFF 305830]|uniref:Uncharacterized protein n=1 Tax=Serendipita vermifera MAFF 305830 TaxID=933852 RepID=A0A0C3AXQ9_SERVB|nr:hypothetical protein M408DRAFT_26734 [Serendipita vermifera MAFF 305830]
MDRLVNDANKIIPVSNADATFNTSTLARYLHHNTPKLESSRCSVIWADFDPIMCGYSARASRSTLDTLTDTADPVDLILQTVQNLTVTPREGLTKGLVKVDYLYHRWSMLIQAHVDDADQKVIQGVREWASAECLRYDDLKSCQKFKELWGIVKRGRLTSITSLLNDHRDEIASQTIRIQSSRFHTVQSKANDERRQAIKQHYLAKIASQKHSPSLSKFLSFPAIKSLITNASGDIAHTLKSRTIQDLISAEVRSWREHARQEVQVLLGSDRDFHGKAAGEPPEWDSFQILVPLEERCTSLFTCSKCSNLEGKYKRAGVLDFGGLCGHECVIKHRNKAQRPKWAVANFKVAKRAQEIVATMIQLKKRSIAYTGTNFLLGNGGEYIREWICGNCAIGPMCVQDLVWHCQRHDEQNISLTLTPVRKGRGYFSFAQSASGKLEEDRKEKKFRCAHCLGVAEDPVQPGLMNVDGIRSHLKSKHDISNPRNNDIYLVYEEGEE